MGYRGIQGDNKQILLDTINSCICIMARGGVNYNEYKYYAMGMDAIRGHVFKGKVDGERSGFYASEIMLFATCLLTGNTYNKVIVKNPAAVEMLKLKGSKKINYMRMVNIDAYACVVEAFRLLNENGYYLDGIE